MIIIGVLLTVVGFIVGIGGGLTLSDSNAMRLNDGTINKNKEAQIATLIAICAIMIMVGCFLFVRNYR